MTVAPAEGRTKGCAKGGLPGGDGTKRRRERRSGCRAMVRGVDALIVVHMVWLPKTRALPVAVHGGPV